jgi:UDP-N-acetylglucosamine:LPS N-acetylglucosamine transferase
MPENQPTILLAGGGTGGHLYPGISVAQSLAKLWPGRAAAVPLHDARDRQHDPRPYGL